MRSIRKSDTDLFVDKLCPALLPIVNHQFILVDIYRDVMLPCDQLDEIDRKTLAILWLRKAFISLNKIEKKLFEKEIQKIEQILIVDLGIYHQDFRSGVHPKEKKQINPKKIQSEFKTLVKENNPKALMITAELFISKGKLQEAKQNLLASLYYDANNVEAMFMIGKILEMQGFQDGANHWYVIAAANEHPLACETLRQHCLKKNSLDEEKFAGYLTLADLFGKLHLKFTKNKDSQFAAGMTAMRARNFNEALNHFLLASRLCQPEASCLVGIIYADRGDFLAAREYLYRADSQFQFNALAYSHHYKELQDKIAKHDEAEKHALEHKINQCKIKREHYKKIILEISDHTYLQEYYLTLHKFLDVISNAYLVLSSGMIPKIPTENEEIALSLLHAVVAIIPGTEAVSVAVTMLDFMHQGRMQVCYQRVSEFFQILKAGKVSLYNKDDYLIDLALEVTLRNKTAIADMKNKPLEFVHKAMDKLYRMGIDTAIKKMAYDDVKQLLKEIIKDKTLKPNEKSIEQLAKTVAEVHGHVSVLPSVIAPAEHKDKQASEVEKELSDKVKMLEEKERVLSDRAQFLDVASSASALIFSRLSDVIKIESQTAEASTAKVEGEDETDYEIVNTPESEDTEYKGCTQKLR